MMGGSRQLHNLVLIATIYIVIMVINGQYSDAPLSGSPLNIGLAALNNFFHYLLLGFFSRNYWMFIILISGVYDAIQLFSEPSTIVSGVWSKLIALISIKYIGLFVGMWLYYIYPYKIDLMNLFT